ncbi:MAG: DnaJ domain-containing protein, partial [Moraxellaceae bacterium]|nr:DnaJ domain-containing protein [Moraxellaceae bacterium]
MTRTTLYDLLGISRHASPEMIQAAYERLSERKKAGTLSHPKMDPDTYFGQIQDAFRTLTHPALRAQYDARLERAATPSPGRDDGEVTTGFAPARWLLLLGVIGLALFYYKTVQNEARQREQERLVAELDAQRAAAAKQREEEAAERESARREEQARIDAERLAEQQRYEAERAFSRADANMRSLESQRERQVRQDSYAMQRGRDVPRDADWKRQQERYAAERRLAQDKAQLRAIEREQRPRVAVLPRDTEQSRRSYTTPYRDERDSTR